ncbi:hypothetical protein DMR22_27015 [Klebsiella pneumoniae]|nr:hypothetical protein DMR22_27015 [Klebsiella pneumoniae]
MRDLILQLSKSSIYSTKPLSKKIFQKNGVYSNSAIAIRILKYILILPWQRQKYSYMKFILRGISHGIKGISGKYH